MLFVNDIVNNINTDLENVFHINELKLFLISHAYDQVIFKTSPETIDITFFRHASRPSNWEVPEGFL